MIVQVPTIRFGVVSPGFKLGVGQDGFVVVTPGLLSGVDSPGFKMGVEQDGFTLGLAGSSNTGTGFTVEIHPLSEPTSSASGLIQFSGLAHATRTTRTSASGLIQFSGQGDGEVLSWRPIALEHDDNTFKIITVTQLKIGDTTLTEQQLIDLLGLL